MRGAVRSDQLLFYVVFSQKMFLKNVLYLMKMPLKNVDYYLQQVHNELIIRHQQIKET